MRGELFLVHHGVLLNLWIYKVFKLLTRQPLFFPMESKEHDASRVDVLLYQMILFCGEFFSDSFLQRCSRSIDYFQLDSVSLILISPFFQLIDICSDQADPGSFRDLFVNHFRSVFSILDVY